MKKIDSVKVHNYNIKTKKLKMHHYQELNVFVDTDNIENNYSYVKYVPDVNADYIGKIMVNHKCDDDTVLSVLVGNDLEVINKCDSKETLMRFREKVSFLTECKVYGLPIKKDKLRVAYEFSKIENLKVRKNTYL
jgi:hypothetical protein